MLHKLLYVIFIIMFVNYVIYSLHCFFCDDVCSYNHENKKTQKVNIASKLLSPIENKDMVTPQNTHKQQTHTK